MYLIIMYLCEWTSNFQVPRKFQCILKIVDYAYTALSDAELANRRNHFSLLKTLSKFYFNAFNSIC